MSDTPRSSNSWERKLATLAALIGVNIFACVGQYEWGSRHLHGPVLAVGFAATIEAIALFWSAQASAATLANDAAGGLKLAAYGTGALVATLNYYAHSIDGKPNAMAVVFAGLSFMSPILWQAYARRAHRDQLAAEGLIDPRTVKVPRLLYVFSPRTAFALLALGIRTGTNHLPTLRKMLAERNTLRTLVKIPGTGHVEAVLFGFGEVGFNPHVCRVFLQERGVIVTAAQIEQASANRPRAIMSAAPVSPAPAGSHETPEEMHARVLASFAGGKGEGRDRVWYAFSVLGERNQAEARRWLKSFGYDSTPSELSHVAKFGRGALTADSGSYPAVTAAPINGHSHELVPTD